MSQDDNYCTAIGDDDLDDTIQFGHSVMEPWLSRSIRISTTEVGCLSFTQMFQEYLQTYPPVSQTEACNEIQQMAARFDVYLNHYPAQHVNCMSADSEFVTFISHAIKLTLDLMAYPTIWAVLSILLETQDVNSSYVQVIHQYHNQCYEMKTREYMEELEQIAERPKHNMYTNTLDGVSAYIQQQEYETQAQTTE